jgi:hypothetical protein
MLNEITIWLKNLKKLKVKMSLLTNMNLFLKANLLLKRKKNIHKTLVSKKINMWQIILNTKKWFHKF